MQRSSKNAEWLLLEDLSSPEEIGQLWTSKNCRVRKKGEASLEVFRQDIKPSLPICVFSGLNFFYERGRAQSSLDRGNMK